MKGLGCQSDPERRDHTTVQIVEGIRRHSKEPNKDTDPRGVLVLGPSGEDLRVGPDGSCPGPYLIRLNSRSLIDEERDEGPHLKNHGE